MLERCSGRWATRATVTALLVLLVAACRTMDQKPITTATHVDLPRFMGDWYVIAHIPTRIERDAYNAVESYRLDADGRILTTFTYRAGAFDGPPKRYEPVGFVKDTTSNAVWGMRFVWPLQADYRIVYLDDAYSTTIVGREKRDYAWIMARSPSIPDADYAQLTSLLSAEGYDLTDLRRVPQKH